MKADSYKKQEEAEGEVWGKNTQKVEYPKQNRQKSR